MLQLFSKLLERWRYFHHMRREGHVGTRKRRKDSIWSEAADRSPVLMVILALILWIGSVGILSLPELRKYPEMVPGQQATSTIFSRVDFEYVDQAATRRKRDEAAANQEHYFQISKNRNEQISRNLDSLFIAIRKRSEQEKLKQAYLPPDFSIAKSVAGLPAGAFKLVSLLGQDQLLKEQFRNSIANYISEGFLNPPELKTQDSKVLFRITDTAGRTRAARPLARIVTLQQVTDDLTNMLLSYQTGQQLSAGEKNDIHKLMETIFNSSGNLELDAPRTIRRREAAIAAVAPVKVEVHKNDIIVQRNSLVSDTTLEILKAHDEMLAMHQQDNDRIETIIRNAFWSLAMILFAGVYMANIHPDIVRRTRSISLIVTVTLLSLLINYLALEVFYFFSGVLAIPPKLVTDALPLAIPAALLAVMAGYRVAFYIGFFAALLSSLMFESSFTVTLEGLILSAIIGVTVRPVGNYRSYFLRVFACVFFTVWILDVDILGMIISNPKLLYFTAGVAFANALFTAIAAMLLTFLFELIFNVSTNMSLMVLCDGNHPLLKELHLKAPGTSLHSQNVAILAEAAALEIQANPVLARAGALYHDIGKIKNPEYFIENNLSSGNPHDKLTPRMSSMIIGNHVKDGLDLALQYKLCRAVRQFIQQHHGTDLIQYFYHLALQGNEPVLESDYRYPGPLPHAKEVVIVSLADACEAACRSLEKPTASKIESMVNEIFRKRWRDGQLDSADLTVEELSLINESFAWTLTTMYHGRIAYPKDENDNENDLFVEERPAAVPHAKTASSADE